jgi:predicted ATPase/DNA-binding CsgD family transcriptional regulator
VCVNEALPTDTPGAVPHLRVPLTSFIGRETEAGDVRRLLAESRLVTLSGAGGIGKTRLAQRIADQVADAFADGVCPVDFAPIADPDLITVTVARALGLSDQPGRSAVDTMLPFVGDRRMLLLLDNCEHLLDASASLVNMLLGACANVKVLATSREPIGVAGEVIWRVPSLSLNDDAVELFTNRARLVRPAFSLTTTNRATVTEICSRLDGMPLAIELAAARIRALSPNEILDGLQDRFRLLTGGARSTVPRQQTLRASVDWSHELLTQPERILFRRLAVFSGGFDLEAAEAVAASPSGGGDLERDEILDLLTLLVDKSLVITEDSETRTRYRLLETMRQYAFEKLGESDEAEALRTRHRDYYALVASAVDAPARTGLQQRLARAVVEIDNFRAAFAWSRARSEHEVALVLASSLQPLWLATGRVHEGLAWFDAIRTDNSLTDIAPMVGAAARADRALLNSWAFSTEGGEEAELPLADAHELGDRVLVRVLFARGIVAANLGEPAQEYFVRAAELAEAVGDGWRLSQIRGWQANLAFLDGNPIEASAAATEGCEIADAIGDRFTSRQCRAWGAWAQTISGDLAGAARQFGATMDEAQADRDLIWWVVSGHYRAQTFVYQGDSNAAAAVLTAVMPAAEDLGPMWSGNSHGVRAVAALASGDVAEADKTSRAARELLAVAPIHQRMYLYLLAEVALARGDLVAAHSYAGEAVSSATGWHRVISLITRARVRIAEHELELAEQDAYSALARATDLKANLAIPDILECLGATACGGGSHPRSARLFGAAESIRRRIGAARFKVHHADREAAMYASREALGDRDFESAFAEGLALSTLEAIAYAQRGKGERRRPTMGWASLTPAEHEVVRLVCDGLANKEIAKRLLISPRTVQTHLTHIYTKLNLTSRVKLVQEAARHGD